MALPSSGPISASMINTELGRSASASFSMNGSAERTLAQRSSGSISFSHFRGKSAWDGGRAFNWSVPNPIRPGGSTNATELSIVLWGNGVVQKRQVVAGSVTSQNIGSWTNSTQLDATSVAWSAPSGTTITATDATSSRWPINTRRDFGLVGNGWLTLSITGAPTGPGSWATFYLDFWRGTINLGYVSVTLRTGFN